MYQVPLIIRGEVIADADLEFGGRRGGTRFMTADVRKHIGRLALTRPSLLNDLYSVSFDGILTYLADLERTLDFETNAYLQEAFELSKVTSGLSEDILRRCYQGLGKAFSPEEARAMTEATVGIRHLEGWVETRSSPGYVAQVRAFGARAVHIVAGNSPIVTAMSIVRNIVSRSDGIIKTPSNDPLTAAAVARTMIDMAPDHPITKHLSVAYWKGGDAAVEDQLYQPRHVEKIIAWGGLASVSHIVKYIQPGIDLITLDPKLSASIIGAAAFTDEAMMREAADRLAHDVGYNNQENCSSARVAYIQTGTDAAGLQTANCFGQMVFEAIQALPAHVSGPVAALDPQLREELAGLRYTDDFRLIGGGLEGGVIVSQIPEPVEFSRLLINRVGNIVPIDDLEEAIGSMTAYTQTVGIFPDALIDEIRDRLAFHGAQRLVALGYSGGFGIPGAQDGIEPLRRMCKWIVQEVSNAPGRPLAAYA